VQRELGVLAAYLHVADLQLLGVDHDLRHGLVDVDIDDHVADERGGTEIRLQRQRVPVRHNGTRKSIGAVGVGTGHVGQATGERFLGRVVNRS
jgi:hypothetical protein